MNLTHKPCPYTACGSSDAFSYSPDKMVGKCHSCGVGYPSNKPKFDWAQERYPTENNGYVESFDSQTATPDNPAPTGNWDYRSLRGITSVTMEMFNVKTLANKAGQVLQQEYIYPSGGIKIRNLTKKAFRAKDFRQDELFGMNLFSSGSGRIVTITEGELDTMSVYQMICKQGIITPVVSLPGAAPSEALWAKCKPWLDGFDKIVLSFDNDEAGRKITQKLANIFPSKVFVVDHSAYKDANEFLTSGKREEFKNAWLNAKKWTPDNVLHTVEDFTKLYTESPEHNYVPTGIQSLDDKIMGLMQGHFTLFKAPTGIGKTELIRFLEWNFINRGVKFASWHLEETKLRSLLGLVSYDLNDNLTRKDLIDIKGRDADVKESIARIAGGNVYFQYYLQGEDGAEELEQMIRLFKEAYDCRFILVEPIQDVISISSTESKEAALANLAVTLSRLAASLDVGIISIAHTNDDGEIKYCRMLGQRASVIVRLERDKDADGDQRNYTKLYVEKNRPCSEEGLAGEMHFNINTFTMREF